MLAVAVAAGVTDGKRPRSYATRQEMAIVASRLLEMMRAE